MIRLAFVAVALGGALIAFLAFTLVRYTGGDAPAPEVVTAQTDVAAPAAAPEADRVHFLKGADITTGTVTLVLRDTLTGRGDLVLHDALTEAMQGSAHANLTPVDPPRTRGAAALLYRDDSLVAAWTCAGDPCGTGGLAPLLDRAQPLVADSATFENHAAYIGDIASIEATDQFMFLDQRPDAPFPAPRTVPRMTIALPTIVARAGTTIDPGVTGALARSIVEPILPEGGDVEDVMFDPTGPGLIADRDSGRPVQAGGAPVPFPDVEFTSVTVKITGVARLDDAALQTLSEQALQQTDYRDGLDAFLETRLKTDCADCFTVRMNGDFYDSATVLNTTTPSYSFSFYDLREAP